jgi:hypothetical protein
VRLWWRGVRGLVLALAFGATLLLGSGDANAQFGAPTAGERLIVEVRPSRASDLIVDGYDVLSANTERVLVLVDDRGWERLSASGYALTVARRIPTTRRAAGATFAPGYYHTYDAVQSELQAVAAAHPTIVSLNDLGGTWETAHGLATRHIWAARISGAASGTKPAILLVAAYHAREIVTPELALRALHLFADDYGRDPLLTYLVDNREIWIVPLANPDGWARVQAGAEWWRKNANPTAFCGSSPGTNASPAHPGVDLNRNHTYQWNAGGGASTDPCADTYQGPSAASELETFAMQTLIASIRPTTLITWHAFGNMVLWPWDYRADSTGADPVLNALGGRLAAIAGYQGGPGGSTLYLTTGELTDWAWANHQTAGFTIEVGSLADTGGNPFVPPYSTVARYWTENRGAALYLARVGDLASRAAAPDVGPPSVSAPIGAATAAIATALSAGSNGAPAAVELFLDVPGAEGSGQVGTIVGTTGTWALPSAAIAPGRHAVWARARDAGGHWGPLNAVSALFARQELLFPSGPQRAGIVP